jgi:alkaline phosphatase D
MAVGFDPARITGNIGVSFINSLAAKLMNPMLPPIDAAAQMLLEKGLSYLDIGKVSFYSSIGSRYLVIKEAYDLLGKARYAATSGASEDVMGKDQEAWFLSTIQGSKATWKVWGNEYCLAQVAIDLSPQMLPAAFQHKFYMVADSWDGYRNKRAELLGKLADAGGVVAITGDIHACFAGTPAADDAGTKKIVEFVCTSITSATFKSELVSQVESDPVLSQVPGASMLAAFIDGLLLDTKTKINPFLGYANSGVNGYAVVSASGAEFAVTMKLIPENQVTMDRTADPAGLAPFISAVPFRALPGQSDLYQQISGAWMKWDHATQKYV